MAAALRGNWEPSACAELEPSTGAGVRAPCSGFGVLGADGPGLGSLSDADTAADGSLAGISSSSHQPREGVLWGMRKGKIPPTFPG